MINGRALTIAEAAGMLRMKVEEVYRLAVHGFIEQTALTDGRMMVSKYSVEKYARRNGIILHNATSPEIKLQGSRTIEQAKAFLGLEDDKDIHKLIQTGRLLARFEHGVYVIDLQSLHDYAGLTNTN